MAIVPGEPGSMLCRAAATSPAGQQRRPDAGAGGPAARRQFPFRNSPGSRWVRRLHLRGDRRRNRSRFGTGLLPITVWRIGAIGYAMNGDCCDAGLGSVQLMRLRLVGLIEGRDTFAASPAIGRRLVLGRALSDLAVRGGTAMRRAPRLGIAA